MAGQPNLVVRLDETQLPIAVNIGSTVDRTAQGTITSTQSVTINTAACGNVGVQISETWTGTLVFESTVDGSIWNSIEADPGDVTSTTTNGSWTIACAGFAQIRVRGNTVGSGSATIFLNASTATSTVVLGEPLPAGDSTVGRVKLTDGSDVASISASGALAVEAASLPLPTGAATAARQDTGNTSLAAIDGKLPALVSGRVPVDGSASTQPVSSANGSQADGHSATLGSTGDADTASTVIGRLKKTVSLLAGGLPAALVNGRLDVSIGASPATVPVSGSVAQGTAAAASGYWPVRNTDGTNLTPAMDAVGRAGYQRITDGTNQMPTMDAAARSGYLRVTDGTSTAAVKGGFTNATTADAALVVASSPSTPTSLFADRTSNATLPSLNTTATLSCTGIGAVAVQISSTWAGTISFQRTTDGSNWRAVTAYPDGDTSLGTTTTTANGYWIIPASGAQTIRCIMTAYTSGSATVWMDGNQAEMAPVATPASSSITTAVALTTTAATLFAANSSSKGRKIYNPTAVTMYVLYGSGTLTGASDASFPIAPGQTWEMPSRSGQVEWNGLIKAVLASGSGNANATEVT